MGDHFLSLLPAGHALRSITLVAARTSLGGEPAFVVPVGPAVVDVRLQCAAIAWALSSAYSSAAVIALPTTARAYLAARLFGVTSGSKTAAALAARIDGHILAHHPAIGAAALGAVNPSVIGFIGPPVPAVAAPAASAQGVGGGPLAYVAPHPGAAGPAIIGDDTGGFASALLAPPQVHALLALPTGELSSEAPRRGRRPALRRTHRRRLTVQVRGGSMGGRKAPLH